MPVIFKALEILHLTELAPDDIGSLNEFFLCTHPGPLERCKGLWHKEGGAGYNLYLSVSPVLGDIIVGFRNLFRKQRNSLHILHCLRGQTQHKIQLHPVPA